MVCDSYSDAHTEFTFAQTKKRVPQILTLLIESIETRGLSKQGIYRVSGKVRDVTELRCSLERDMNNVKLDDAEKWDTSVLCQVVKMYLRELPVPLFPFFAAERVEYSRMPFEITHTIYRLV